MIDAQCGGKVILFGEYAVIEGGPALVVSCEPSFKITATPVGSINQRAGRHPFADQSPAGLFLNSCRPKWEQYDLQWDDPYQTPIGVGSSSAQFVLSINVVRRIQGLRPMSLEQVLDLYWNTVGSTQGLRPSGADVAAQYKGGALVFSNRPVKCDELGAPEWSSQFLLAFTGIKAKTHEHLIQLCQRGFPREFSLMLDQLNALTLRAQDLWTTPHADKFGELMNEYQAILEHNIDSPAEYRKKISALQNSAGVLGAKGCGAQGGDCVLVLADSQDLDPCRRAIEAVGWQSFDLRLFTGNTAV